MWSISAVDATRAAYRLSKEDGGSLMGRLTDKEIVKVLPEGYKQSAIFENIGRVE